jgi:energy-coupling factor transporter transmembrane protein EcfT
LNKKTLKLLFSITAVATAFTLYRKVQCSYNTVHFTLLFNITKHALKELPFTFKGMVFFFTVFTFIFIVIKYYEFKFSNSY